jgi:hypothetical protein
MKLTPGITFKNCLNEAKGNCQMCAQLYFLFTLPQDHPVTGWKAGTRVCVEWYNMVIQS